jgi:hypothetical protein
LRRAISTSKLHSPVLAIRLTTTTYGTRSLPVELLVYLVRAIGAADARLTSKRRGGNAARRTPNLCTTSPETRPRHRRRLLGRLLPLDAFEYKGQYHGTTYLRGFDGTLTSSVCPSRPWRCAIPPPRSLDLDDFLRIAGMMNAGYELRSGGDAKTKKQSMAELKLRRLNELNFRLREDLDRRRIPVSEAATEYETPFVLTFIL